MIITDIGYSFNCNFHQHCCQACARHDLIRIRSDASSAWLAGTGVILVLSNKQTNWQPVMASAQLCKRIWKRQAVYSIYVQLEGHDYSVAMLETGSA